MSADSPRRSSSSRGIVAATVPPQVVSDRSILDSAIGFINDVTLTNQPHTDPKDTITWARFETAADISDPRYGDDWELEGNVAPPLLLLLGYGLGVQVWAIPANGEAIEVLSWRHGIVSALRILPTPTTAACSTTFETHGRADELVDIYAEKRPLIALVDGSASAGSQPQFCAVNFISLKTGSQVKTIKFKNPVLDILANRSSIVITFHERIAIFDARTLEDRLSITTCFPSPGINPNPVALGPRWLAYAEHKLLHSKRSGGGCDGEGVASYTATVLNAAKSLGKGLRELGEQVAAGLTGTTGSTSNSKNNSFDSQSGIDAKQPGVVTILDIKHPIKDYSPTSGTPLSGQAGTDPIVAHFIAHSEAVVAMDFDNSGMLLVTADRRGHDFHIFRIQPHPVGSSLAAVHHLYVLHRGDTSAKVQNIAFSLDARWVAVSTLRGTTHVFPITPYGGPMGVRTHTSLHVVNKLSRFHRSAGLSADGRSSSPISHSESTTFTQSLQPYHNPTLPPFPRPTVVQPLAQLRQPFALGSPPGSAGLSMGGGSVGSKSGSGNSTTSQRQRLSSLSDDNGKPLSVCAIFAKSRSWLLEPPNVTREAPHRIQRKAVDSLFVMAGHGALIQYDLDTKLASNVAKEKICDDTPIELEVEAKAQWNLGRRREGSQEIMPPLSTDNWLIRHRNSCVLTDSTRQYDDADDRAESWLSQVEIITHAGPHRRLWMGPQFVFKTYNAPSGSNLNHVDSEAVEIGVSKASTAAALARAERSSPLSIAGRSAVPVLIESGSYSSIEQSPKLMDRFRHDHLDSDFAVSHGDTRLKEDLADAMRESPSVSSAQKNTGRLTSHISSTTTTTADGGTISSTDNPTFYDALAEHENENFEHYAEQTSFDANRSHSSSMASAVALASVLPNLSSYDTSSGYESYDSYRKIKPSIEKIVNPLGTVTTITAGMSAEVKTDMLDEVVSQLASEECVIHENCDEALFRPVVAIFCDEKERKRGEEEAKRNEKFCQPPEVIDNKLIVPVIAKEVDAELSKKEKQKSVAKSKQQQQQQLQHQQQQQQQQQKNNEQKKEQLVGFDKLNDGSGGIGGKNKTKPLPAARIVKATTLEQQEYKVKVVETAATNPNVVNSKLQKRERESVECDESKIKELPEIKTTAKISTKLSTKDKTAQNLEPIEKFQKPENNGKSFELLNSESPTKSGEIKAEILNVADLADSLIEIQEDVEDKTELKNTKEKCKKKIETIVKEETKSKQEMAKKEIEEKVEQQEEELKKSKNERATLKAANEKQKKMVEEEISNAESISHKIMNTKEEQKDKIKSKNEELETVKSKETISKTAKINETIKSKEEEEIKKTIKKEKIAEFSSLSSETAPKEMLKKLEPQKDEPNIVEKSETQQVETKIEESKPIPLNTLPSTKSSKKKKKSQSRPSSNSNSETEEIIEITTTSNTQKSKKTKQKERRSSQSSEGSCAELEQSIVETENSTTATKNESMFLSFLQTEEKKVKTQKLEEEKKHKTEEVKEEIEIIKIEEIKSKTNIDKKTLTKEIDKNIKLTVEEKPSKTEDPIKDTSKGAIKKEITKQEENLVKAKIEISTESAPKTPPRSPKKKANDSASNSPAKVITQQPTKTKNEIIDYQTTKSTKTEEDVTDSPRKSKQNITTSPQKLIAPPPQPPASPWKMLSGADLINKNLESLTLKSENVNFPSLGKETAKSSKNQTKVETNEKLLPDFPAPTADIKSPIIKLKSATPAKFQSIKVTNKKTFEDFTLEPLPPLPSLEPLEVPKSIKESTGSIAEQISLITFESSPKQEHKRLEHKIKSPTQTQAGDLSEENLIYALCGSFHYEDENHDEDLTMPALPDLDDSPFTVDALDIIKPKKKTSSYISSYAAEKCLSSSPCSSASEEIIVLEEKKMTKKQRRKRQQQLQEKQNSEIKIQKSHEVDEELRPLIGDGMIDSQMYLDTMTSSEHFGMSTTPSTSTAASAAAAQFLEIPTSSTTTDSSEGPMPATTSDDNVFVMPSTKTNTAPNKVKTKKLEHKFNLFAAIEAATSTSNSSAEESGVEGGGGRASDNDITTHHHLHHHHQYHHLHHSHHTPLAANSLIGSTSSAAGGAMLTLPTSLSVSAQLSATKKKTKRRKR